MSKRFASAGRAARPPSRNVLVKVVRTTFYLVVPLQFCHKRQKSIFRVKPRRPFLRTTRLGAICRKRSLFPPPLYLLSLRCMENGRRTWIEKSKERERGRERKRERRVTGKSGQRTEYVALCFFVAIVVVYYSSSGEPISQ